MVPKNGKWSTNTVSSNLKLHYNDELMQWITSFLLMQWSYIFLTLTP